MGQDRQFTEDEIKFVLETLKHFKEVWEKVERKNLEKDVQWKIDAIDYDNNYTDHFKTQDEAEIEKQIEEAVVGAQNAKTAEGEEDLTEAEKEQITKEAKFNCAIKSFYAPEEAAEFKAKAEQALLAGQMGDADGGGSQMDGSVDQNSKDGADVSKDAGPPYTPLVPE